MFDATCLKRLLSSYSEGSNAIPPIASTMNPRHPVGEATPLRALLVEDEDSILALMRRHLEDLGLTVTSARNGREGLDRYRDRSAPFDILVSDIVMPELGGREMIDRIRKERPELPVLITSGTGTEGLEDLLEQPTVTFLAKPFRGDDFRARVRALLPPKVARAVGD